MKNIIHQKPGVFYCQDAIACLSEAELELIKSDALVAPFRRSRLCMHKSADDAVQEMIIAICQDSYIVPHRHLGKSESFHVIEGQAAIFIFDDLGGIRQIISLGHACRDGFFYRLSASLYHTVLSVGDLLVIHETSAGPFREDQTSFAPFAPDPKNGKESAAYLAMLRSHNNFHKGPK